MKVGDLVRTPRYGTYYLIVGKRRDLRHDAFIVHSLDGKTRQTLSKHLLEVISESR